MTWWNSGRTAYTTPSSIAVLCLPVLFTIHHTSAVLPSMSVSIPQEAHLKYNMVVRGDPSVDWVI